MPPLNPWIALPDGGPSASRTRQLRVAHELFVTGGARPSEVARRVRPVVLDSWNRCLGSGVCRRERVER